MPNLSAIDPELMGCFGIAVAVATGVVHVMLAIGVWADAMDLAHERRTGKTRRKFWFLGLLLWPVATLLTGVIGATAYWLMHRSTLVIDPQPHPEKGSMEGPE